MKWSDLRGGVNGISLKVGIAQPIRIQIRFISICQKLIRIDKFHMKRNSSSNMFFLC